MYLKNLFRSFLNNSDLRFLPISFEILKYRTEYLIPDIVSGLAVSLLVFPQSMIYALLAGLPIEFGIYGAIVATTMSSFFSGSRFLNLGPTNSTAVLLLSSFIACNIPPDQVGCFLPIVLIMAGTFLVISAFLNVASMIRYISKSVILGYMTAVIVIMIINQLHNVLGFELNIAHDRSTTLFDVLKSTVVGLKDISFSSLGMSLLTIFLYKMWHKIAPNSIFIALTIISVSLTSYLLIKNFNCNIQTLNKIYVSSWTFSFAGLNFDNMSLMANTALALTFICLIDGTTILKTLSARTGKQIRVNQMVYGMGLANIGCGLCSGMPASGSLLRSSTNYISGAKTSLTSLFCGIFCLMGLFFFGPFFNYVPKAGLSMLIILLGCNLFEKTSIRIILNSNPSDICVFFATLIFSFVFPLNVSIFLGVSLSIILFLRKAAVPEFYEYVSENDEGFFQTDIKEISLKSELSIIHVEGNLFFASADLFREQLREICKKPQLKAIILKLRNAFYIDATCLLALKELTYHMHNQRQFLILSEVRKQVYKTLKKTKLLDIIGVDNVFIDDFRHLNASTMKAMKHAQFLIGQKEIFVSVLVKKDIKRKLKQSFKSLAEPLKNVWNSIEIYKKK